MTVVKVCKMYHELKTELVELEASAEEARVLAKATEDACVHLRQSTRYEEEKSDKDKKKGVSCQPHDTDSKLKVQEDMAKRATAAARARDSTCSAALACRRRRRCVSVSPRCVGVSPPPPHLPPPPGEARVPAELLGGAAAQGGSGSPARQASAKKRAKEAAVSTTSAGRSRVPQVGDVVECEMVEPEAPDGVEWLPGSVTWVDARTKKMKVFIQCNEDDEEYQVRVCCLMANAVCPRAFAPCARAERGQRAFGAAARG